MHAFSANSFEPRGSAVSHCVVLCCVTLSGRCTAPHCVALALCGTVLHCAATDRRLLHLQGAALGLVVGALTHRLCDYL